MLLQIEHTYCHLQLLGEDGANWWVKIDFCIFISVIMEYKHSRKSLYNIFCRILPPSPLVIATDSLFTVVVSDIFLVYVIVYKRVYFRFLLHLKLPIVYEGTPRKLVTNCVKHLRIVQLQDLFI